MQLMLRTTLLALVILTSGCAIRHDYAWQEYQIEPQRVPLVAQVANAGPVQVIKGTAEETEMFMGNVGAHQYYGNRQQLLNAIADQLILELGKQGIVVNDSASKSMKVGLSSSSFEAGMWKIAASLAYSVELGNGTSRSYSVRNSTPGTVERAYNGAVALAVIDILNDEEVISYLGN